MNVGREEIERFAALIAAHECEKLTAKLINEAQLEVQRVVLAEREACAKVCDTVVDCCFPENPTQLVVKSCAAAIRARSETK